MLANMTQNRRGGWASCPPPPPLAEVHDRLYKAAEMDRQRHKLRLEEKEKAEMPKGEAKKLRPSELKQCRPGPPAPDCICLACEQREEGRRRDEKGGTGPGGGMMGKGVRPNYPLHPMGALKLREP